MRRHVIAGLTTVLALSLVACGEDEPEGSATPSASPSSPSASSSASSSGATEPEESASPTAAPSPAVDAASGPELTTATAAVNAPEGWFDQPFGDDGTRTTTGPDADVRYNLTITDGNAVGGVRGLDELVASAEEFGQFKNPPERLADIEVAGFPAYHLTGIEEALGTALDEFGFGSETREYTLVITTPQDLPDAERQALLDSILASFRITA